MSSNSMKNHGQVTKELRKEKEGDLGMQCFKALIDWLVELINLEAN